MRLYPKPAPNTLVYLYVTNGDHPWTETGYWDAASKTWHLLEREQRFPKPANTKVVGWSPLGYAWDNWETIPFYPEYRRTL